MSQIVTIQFHTFVTWKVSQINTGSPRVIDADSAITFFNPYWQILENHPENFSKFQFSGWWARPYHWKTHPSKFYEYLFSFCKISGHEPGRITGKSTHIWMCFPVKRSVTHTLEFIKYYFWLNALFWMSFPVIRSSSFPENLPINVSIANEKSC